MNGSTEVCSERIRTDSQDMRPEPKLTSDSVRRALPEAQSRKQLLELLGVALARANYKRLARIAEEEGLELPDLKSPGNRQRRASRLDDAASFIRAAEESRSLAEMAVRLGCSPNSLNSLRKAAERHGVALPDGRATRSGNHVATILSERASRILVQGSRRVAGTTLKHICFGLGLLTRECSSCGIGEEWNEKPLVLQIDHVNGDPTDNRIENLQILCPNCHTQTDTFAGRKLSKSA